MVFGLIWLNSCKGGTPRDLVSVRVSFFNHTEGPLGEKTIRGASGVGLTIKIDELGYSGVDSNIIVVRKSASREVMGTFIGFSKSGTISLEYPDTDETWEAYLMNGGTNYQLIDELSSRLLSRTIYWLRRDWNASGPEEPISDAYDQFNSALEYQWKQYGKFVNGDMGIRIETGYGSNSSGLPSFFNSFSDPKYIKVDPAFCPSYEEKIKHFLQNIFKLSTKTLSLDGDIYLHNTICDQQTGNLNQAGINLLAYVYLKDAK